MARVLAPLPEMAGEMVDGFVQQYREGGWVSRWSSPGYANLMTGTSSDVSFADAYTKGVKGFDAVDAYEAAVKNATVAPPGSNPDNTDVGRKGLQRSIFLGYTPDQVSEGVSWALEGYINDYGIARMGQALAADRSLPGPSATATARRAVYFLDRSRRYTEMFDEQIGFFQGKDAAGEWKSTPDEYDPEEWGHEHDYTETNGWNFAFHVPFDGAGLAELYGGRDELADKLDTFYATPETGTKVGSYGGVIHEMIEARDVRMGMWGFSNQVAHHIPWMYTHTGQPWKTQAITREVLSRHYTGSEIGQGYAGDEDNGETSAWWVFSALGFYPLQLGSGTYAAGSPLFDRATVHLENGKNLVIDAPANSAENVYVQGVRSTARSGTSRGSSTPLCADGGVVRFDMGRSPARGAPAARPCPRRRATTRHRHSPTPPAAKQASPRASAGAARLFDDTSATVVDLAGRRHDRVPLHVAADEGEPVHAHLRPDHRRPDVVGARGFRPTGRAGQARPPPARVVHVANPDPPVRDRSSEGLQALPAPGHRGQRARLDVPGRDRALRRGGRAPQRRGVGGGDARGRRPGGHVRPHPGRRPAHRAVLRMDVVRPRTRHRRTAASCAGPTSATTRSRRSSR